MAYDSSRSNAVDRSPEALCRRLADEMATSISVYWDAYTSTWNEDRVRVILDLLYAIEPLKPQLFPDLHGVISKVKRFIMKKFPRYEKHARVMDKYQSLEYDMWILEQNVSRSPQEDLENMHIIEGCKMRIREVSDEIKEFLEDDYGRLRLSKDESLRLQLVELQRKQGEFMEYLEELIMIDNEARACHKRWNERLIQLKEDIEKLNSDHLYAKGRSQKMEDAYTSLRRRLVDLL